MKSYLRANCDCTISGLRERIPFALGSENIPLATIRRFSRRSWAYFEAYAQGHDVVSAEDRQKRTHRGLTKSVEESIERATFHTNTNDINFEGSEEHTSELQSLMSISYAVFCLKKKKNT